MSVERLVHVGVAEMRWSADPFVRLVTYGLGPCLGIAVYDPGLKMGALLHAQLPVSLNNPDKAKANPFLYVDTGLVATLRALVRRGAALQKLQVWMAGGSSPRGGSDIGSRNASVAEYVLRVQGIALVESRIGGRCARSITLDVGRGLADIRAVEGVA